MDGDNRLDIQTDRRDKNLICIPFAFKENAKTGVNVKGDAYTIYFKNACVALCSAKYYNPDSEVCFVSNIEEEAMPAEYVRVLKSRDIRIVFVPFDTFVFPDDYLWSLAFYKLCVLKYFSTSEYKNICYMDTDVYIQGSFQTVWTECAQNILLFDINHGLGVKDYRTFCEEISLFDCEKINITHYGGEFFVASKENAQEFILKAENIYEEMRRRDFNTSKGDEFIISLVAYDLKSKIKNAGAYIFRFWTGASFRLVSSCFEYNRITILHLPDEKNRGMIDLYNSYIKRGKIPKDKTVWRKCRLTKLPVLDTCKKLVKRILKK